MLKRKQWYYFSFGSGQSPGIGYYTRYFGTYSTTRDLMVRDYGSNWSFQYNSAEALGVDRYNLTLINYGYNYGYSND